MGAKPQRLSSLPQLASLFHVGNAVSLGLRPLKDTFPALEDPRLSSSGAVNYRTFSRNRLVRPFPWGCAPGAPHPPVVPGPQACASFPGSCKCR